MYANFLNVFRKLINRERKDYFKIFSFQNWNKLSKSLYRWQNEISRHNIMNKHM